MADFRENLGHRPVSPLDLVGIAVDENGDDFLVSSDEALQAALPEINFFLRLHDIVLAVDELLDKLERAGAPPDFAQEQLALGCRRFDPEDFPVNAYPVCGSVRNFLPPLRKFKDVDLGACHAVLALPGHLVFCSLCLHRRVTLLPTRSCSLTDAC